MTLSYLFLSLIHTRSMIWLSTFWSRRCLSLILLFVLKARIASKHVGLRVKPFETVVMFLFCSGAVARASCWLHGKALRRLCLKRSSTSTLGLSARQIFGQDLIENKTGIGVICLKLCLAVSAVFPVFFMFFFSPGWTCIWNASKRPKMCGNPARLSFEDTKKWPSHMVLYPCHDVVGKVQHLHSYVFVRFFAFIWFSL